MDKQKSVAHEVQVRPRLRVMWGKEIALGPGRVELMEFIRETGSLRAAAERMGISYMRAWNLVKLTNRCFIAPVVEASRGGQTGGGAKLTEAGKEVIELYRQMEKESQRAVKQPWAELRKLLKT
jgi:molybdate transport system regulatory protein